MSNPPSDDAKVPFQPATAKLKLGSFDKKELFVEAQYNPKELQIDKTVPWAKHNQTNKAGTQKASDGKIHLEFTGAEGRTLQIELLFDQYEQKDRKEDKSENIAGLIGKLEEMATVRDASSAKEDMRRPHMCVVTWGATGMPSFRCVIESLSTKYNIFDKDGTPLRATCTVKLKEADDLTLKKEDLNPTPAAPKATKK